MGDKGEIMATISLIRWEETDFMYEKGCHGNP